MARTACTCLLLALTLLPASLAGQCETLSGEVRAGDRTATPGVQAGAAPGQPIQDAAAASPAQEEQLRVASAAHDFDGDGRTDTLAVMMLDGRRYDDTAAWCGRGEKFEGRFAVEVRPAAGDTTRFALRDYSFFRDRGDGVVLEDYDHDGRADFNLGQYASCNGWRYRLYTVDSSGGIRRLRVGSSRDGWLPVSDFANSTEAIRPTERGFEICFYDSSATHTVRRYAWNAEEGRFVLMDEAFVETCRRD